MGQDDRAGDRQEAGESVAEYRPDSGRAAAQLSKGQLYDGGSSEQHGQPANESADATKQRPVGCRARAPSRRGRTEPRDHGEYGNQEEDQEQADEHDDDQDAQLQQEFSAEDGKAAIEHVAHPQSARDAARHRGCSIGHGLVSPQLAALKWRDSCRFASLGCAREEMKQPGEFGQTLAAESAAPQPMIERLMARKPPPGRECEPGRRESRSQSKTAAIRSVPTPSPATRRSW